ncbi:MAG: isoprenylcysteine carboxylmethyltransferase family protein [Planctomycetota bacterium]
MKDPVEAARTDARTDATDGAWLAADRAHVFEGGGVVNRRVASLCGSFAFFWIAPATVAGLIPWLLTGWSRQTPPAEDLATRWLGYALVALGAISVVECFARFAIQGLGTPSPVAPTDCLVVSGLYRYVRNPMYVGVLAAIVGQTLLFRSLVLLGYAALVGLWFFAFVVLYEEPHLRRRYGSAYAEYRANVPRWVPRITPWKVPGANE